MTKEQTLNELFKEIRRNYQLLKKGAEVIHKRHKRGDATAGMRGIIEVLFEEGAKTVPHIAKLKHVTRQNIQSIVDQMFELGWAHTRPNPFHKKSVLIDLTDEGKKAFEKMQVEELEYMKKLDLDMPSKKIEDTKILLEELNAKIVKFLEQQE
jgi:DNA-binding MarR family transcriptional regulator